MSRLDGGARAASGLFYQYLFTIEHFLRLLDGGWPPDTAIWIDENEIAESEDPDVIDFSVHHPERGIVAVHQAKSTVDPTRRTISAAQALMILIRLSRSVDCPDYVLTTNARPGRGIADLNRILLQARAQPSMADESFLSVLRDLVAGSEEALAALASVSAPDAMARLRRGRVHATGETSSMIRSRIREGIRTWRAEHGLALSDNAAGLVENSIISEVFERAAGTAAYEEPGPSETAAARRVVSLSAFTGLLAASPHLLAEGVGADETSIGLHHVPSGEGIVRSEQLAAISERFDNVRSRHIRWCALVGRSGIGKSRLAAMYAHSNRQAYDRVCWINAESQAAVLASIVGQRRTLGLEGIEQQPAHQVAESFRASIAMASGRWLIVFDNARHPSRIEQWLPHAGVAHLLITSNNSVNWTAFRPLKVPQMTEEQAVELLRSRLELDTPPTETTAAAENAIIRKFDGWPLALQIVAAHFGSLSRLVRGVDAYLAQIADYVFDDETLDRDGYPHPLQVAINMCLDRLAYRASDDPAAATGLDMLVVGSVFASHAIPETLLYSAATIPKGALFENDGIPTLVADRDLPDVDRAIRQIRTESLIGRTESSDEMISPELRMHIEINEVIQRVVRNRVELGSLLDQAAAHLTSWLDHYITLGSYAEAVAIQPHSLSVLEHAAQWTGDLEKIRWCALLAGNQSALLDVQGRSMEAMEWLNFELDILHSMPQRSNRLIAKTAYQLFQSVSHLGGLRDEMVPYINVTLEALEGSATSSDVDWDAEQLRFSIESWVDISINKARFVGEDTTLLIEIKNRIQALDGAFSDEGFSNYDEVISGINDHITEGRVDQAIAEVDSALIDLPTEKHLVRLILAAYRIEALAHLVRTSELASRLEEFEQDLGRHPEIRTSIGTILLDGGFALCLKRLLGIETDTAALIDKVARMTAALLVSDYDRCRHALLTGFLLSSTEDASKGDREGVRSILQFAKSIRPPNIPDNVLTSGMIDYLESWLDYWMECADLGKTARFIIGMPSGRRRTISAAAELVLLLLEVPEDFRVSLPISESISAQWIDFSAGMDGIIDIRGKVTNGPIAWILIGAQEDIYDMDFKSVDLDLNEFDGLVLTTSDSPRKGPEVFFSARQ